jgi:hypothetical protein
VVDVVAVLVVGVAVASVVEVAEVDLEVVAEEVSVVDVVVIEADAEVVSVDVEAQEELLKSNSREHAKCYERYKNFYCLSLVTENSLIISFSFRTIKISFNLFIY